MNPLSKFVLFIYLHLFIIQEMWNSLEKILIRNIYSKYGKYFFSVLWNMEFFYFSISWYGKFQFSVFHDKEDFNFPYTEIFQFSIYWIILNFHIWKKNVFQYFKIRKIFVKYEKKIFSVFQHIETVKFSVFTSTEKKNT